MARANPGVAAARVPAAVPRFWRRHIGEASALDGFDGFASQARDGSVQLRLGHGISFHENRKRGREEAAFFGGLTM
jgi:hypothetical protein